jgi:flagellin
MSVINTNVNAIIARNASQMNERVTTKAMQQLSTGKRINVAADDAAGLAISTKMTSQIRGLDQAVRNANDGISMLQVAEGATVEMTNMLQRMRELAVQSANDTNTSSERSYLDDEFQQLRQEIDRIAQTTQWNGVNLMDGTGAIGGTATGTLGGKNVAFQVGANASQTISLDVANFRTNSATTATIEQYNFKESTATDAVNGVIVTLAGTAQTEVSFTAITNAATTLSAWQTNASNIQTALRTQSNMSDIVVTATGVGVIQIEDAAGRTVAASFVTGSSMPTTAGTPAGTQPPNSQVQAGAVSSAGVFAAADLNSKDITNSANANTALAAVDTALGALNSQRSGLGATINRLTYAADNLTNTSANVSAARSRVLDTDYAQATTELARSQIIQQASTAMLAQANQGAQSVLSLLK